MKKIAFFIVFSVVAVFAKAQDMSGKNTAVSYFMLTVSDEFVTGLKDLETAVADMRQYGFKDKLTAVMGDTMYAMFNRRLAQKTGAKILPVSTLKDDVTYGFYGYPLASGKKAAKSKKAEYYYKVSINIYAGSSSGSDLSVGGVYSSTKRKIKPTMQLSVRVYDANGKKIKKLRTMVTATQPVELGKDLLWGVLSANDKPDNNFQNSADSFTGLMNQAMDKLMAKW